MAEHDHKTTQQLVLQSQGGDREAFNQLFARYYPRIRLLVKLHMMDKLRAQVEADDIIQEIYLEVYKNFHKFEYRDPNSFYKWIVTVIGWKIRDFDKYFFKTSKRQPGETLSLDQRVRENETSSFDLGDVLRSDSATPSQIVMQKEGYKMLEKAMEKLPAHYRQVIKLRHLEQRSSQEAAEILDLKVNAVNVLFHRAQQKLHQVLKEMTYFQ